MSGQPEFLGDQPRPTRDYAFIAALLGLGAIPLLGLRNHPLLYTSFLAPAVWVAGACLFAAWVLPGQRRITSALWKPRGWTWWARAAGFVAALGAAAHVVYCLPMREHFWGGYDEILCLKPAMQAVWYWEWDQLGRPTWGIAPLLGALMTPGRVEGLSLIHI